MLFFFVTETLTLVAIVRTNYIIRVKIFRDDKKKLSKLI